MGTETTISPPGGTARLPHPPEQASDSSLAARPDVVAVNPASGCEQDNIAFNHGEYDPSSPESQHVIAHELAHVRQQTGGDVSMLPQEDVQMEVDPDPKLEKEAEETAQRVMSGGELGIQRMSKTEVHVQRFGAELSMALDALMNIRELHKGQEEAEAALGEIRKENLEEIAELDQEDQDMEVRVANLEQSVEYIGSILASQMGDSEASTGAKVGEAMSLEAMSGVIGTGAGFAMGGPLGAIIAGMITAGSVEAFKQEFPDIADVLDNMRGQEGAETGDENKAKF